MRVGARLTTVFRAGLRARLRYVSFSGIVPTAGPLGTWVQGAMAAYAATSTPRSQRGQMGNARACAMSVSQEYGQRLAL